MHAFQPEADRHVVVYASRLKCERSDADFISENLVNRQMECFASTIWYVDDSFIFKKEPERPRRGGFMAMSIDSYGNEFHVIEYPENCTMVNPTP